MSRTQQISGRQEQSKLAEFDNAPPSLQAAFWRELREHIDAHRAFDVWLDWALSDAPLSEEPTEIEWPMLHHRRRPLGSVRWDEGWARRARAIRKAELNPEADWTPSRDEDPLIDIPARVYVEVLTGEDVPASGNMRCPLLDHDDRNPSFRVYDGAGWRCFGCVRSGTIYDLAAFLWDIEPRGSSFVELHKRLRGMFGM